MPGAVAERPEEPSDWIRDQVWRDREVLASEFASGEPFRHVVIEDLLQPTRAAEVAAAFPKADETWIRFAHINERKFGNPVVSTFPDPLRELVSALSGPRFVAWLESITGIARLMPDPDLCGGGLHQTQRGGFLNIHTDFTGHPHRSTWRRAVNLVLFLNSEWQDSYGGALEFWPSDMQERAARVVPRLNRCVIFQVGTKARHGHPEPLDCPLDRTRNSLALFYFTDGIEPGERQATRYYPRPGDGARAALIRVENVALRVFDRLRLRGWITDQGAGRLLARLQR